MLGVMGLDASESDMVVEVQRLRSGCSGDHVGRWKGETLSTFCSTLTILMGSAEDKCRSVKRGRSLLEVREERRQRL